MLPLYGLLDGVRQLFAGEVGLSAWSQQRYKRNHTVWIGNRSLEHIPADAYPMLLCVADDTPYHEDRMNLGIAVYNDDVETALRDLSDLTELVLALLGRSTGYVFDVRDRLHDNDRFHPAHTLTLALTVHAIDPALAGEPRPLILSVGAV